jgi:hypothetical protein
MQQIELRIVKNTFLNGENNVLDWTERVSVWENRVLGPER